MRFDYEITLDEYVGAQHLYYKLTGTNDLRTYVPWILAGLFFIIVEYNDFMDDALRFASLLLAGIGIWWIFVSVKALFVMPRLRRAYVESKLEGTKFSAIVDQRGFSVVGDLCSWQVHWEGVSLRGENAQAFILDGANTLFVFGKRYLTAEQQEELRTLSKIQER
jgi:hypothetical protein